MKHPNRHTVSRLEDLPNVGKATAGDFHTIGIEHPQDLIGQDAYRMYDTLCETTGTRHDPCMIDIWLTSWREAIPDRGGRLPRSVRHS